MKENKGYSMKQLIVDEIAFGFSKTKRPCVRIIKDVLVYNKVREFFIYQGVVVTDSGKHLVSTPITDDEFNILTSALSIRDDTIMMILLRLAEDHVSFVLEEINEEC